MCHLSQKNIFSNTENDKGSAVVVWSREEYLREANSQLSDNDVYWEVKGDAEGPLLKVVKDVLRNFKFFGCE